MKFLKTKLAFTLAEILIVLVVIGVITAILLPVAIQSSPDENVMKFKKGNATLGKVISELVNSDEYYADGDLGKKPNGNVLKTGDEKDIKYFCETFADVVTAKEVNCSTYHRIDDMAAYFDVREAYTKDYPSLDETCKTKTEAGVEIVTSDNITYYQTAPNFHFGYIIKNDSAQMEYRKENNYDTTSSWLSKRMFTTPCVYHCDDNIPTASALYKVFCMDIDEIGKGEDPFGYGLRVDGKILYGERAKEWMKKSIQKGDS